MLLIAEERTAPHEGTALPAGLAAYCGQATGVHSSHGGRLMVSGCLAYAQAARYTLRALCSASRASTLLATSSMPWLDRAGRLPGRSLYVAIAIEHQLDLAKTPQSKLEAKIVRRFGVNRHAERRPLAQLETAGLIRVSRSSGRRPVVSILDKEIDTRV
jgi:hypothetical protein